MKLSYLTVLYILFLSQLYSAFQGTKLGVRANSMGDSFIALSDDSSAILFNPAGLAHLKNREISFFYTKPYLGIKEINLDYLQVAVVPYTDKISIGYAWTQFTSDNIYFEEVHNFGIAKDIKNLLIGVNFKLLSQRYIIDETMKQILIQQGEDIFSRSTQKFNFTFDVGMIVDTFENIKYGLTLRNITQPDTGIKYNDIIPFELVIGASHSLKILEKLTISADLTYKNLSWGGFNDRITLSTGCELIPIKGYTLRCGVNNTTLSFGFGMEMVDKPLFKFDYMFSLPFYITGNYGNHGFSVSLLF